MLRKLFTLALILKAFQAGAFEGNNYRSYGNDEGGYYYFGLGSIATASLF